MPDTGPTVAPAGTRQSYLLGAGFTLAAVFLFTASHGIVRLLSGGLHPTEIAFFSNVFSFLFYVPWLIRNGIGAMRTPKFHIHFVRSFFNAAALMSWYTALFLTPLGDAVALAQTGPLFLTLAAILFLGEQVGPRRWAALGIGAIGALVIIRPGFEEFSLGFIFVLAGACFSAGTKIFAKILTRYDSPAACGAYVALLQIPITFAFAIWFWREPTLEQILWLAAIGLLVGAAHLTMVQAFRYSDVSAVEPLYYTRLVWAAAIGYFFFAEFPDLWTWVGCAIIVGATTYVARRESAAGTIKRRTPADSPAPGP